MRAYRKANKNNSLSGDQLNGGRNCKGTIPNNMAPSGHRLVGLQKKDKKQKQKKKGEANWEKGERLRVPFFLQKFHGC